MKSVDLDTGLILRARDMHVLVCSGWGGWEWGGGGGGGGWKSVKGKNGELPNVWSVERCREFVIHLKKERKKREGDKFEEREKEERGR